MPNLTADDLSDLLVTTREQFEEQKWEDISPDLTDFVAVRQLIVDKKVVEDGGDAINWTMMHKNSAAASHTGLYDVEQVDVDDVMVEATIPWRFTKTNFGFDIRERALNSPSEVQLVNLMKVRRHDGFMSLAELMEEVFWSEPASSTDKVKPLGLFHYLQRKVTGSSAATSTGEYGGGNPTGYSDGCAGVSSTTYPNYANWTQAYADVTATDLVDKMARAAFYTNFQSPHPYPEIGKGAPSKGIYCRWETFEQWRHVAMNQNENLGPDADKYGYKNFNSPATFQGIDMTPVPQLKVYDENNAAATNAYPVLMVNWAKFYPVFAEGWYLREHKPYMPANQPDVLRVRIDLVWNFKCTSRRHQAYLSKVV